MVAQRSLLMKDVLLETRPPIVEQRHLVTRSSRRMSDVVNVTAFNSHATTLQSEFMLPEVTMVHAASTQTQLNFGGIPSQNHISTNIGSRNHLDVTPSLPSEMPYSEDSGDDDLNEGTYTNGHVNMTKKKGRGPTKPWYDWGKSKIILEWDEMGNPVGEHAKKFGSKIRSYARNGTMFPLNFTRWDSKANKSTLEQIWKEVQANTNAPEIFKPVCFTRIAKAWKSFKNRIKTDYYDVHETDSIRFANKPEGVLPDQWVDLVKYWGLESSKNVSLRNKSNRANLFAYSKTGRTPHACIRAQRIKDKLPVDNLSMWLATRNKDGKYDTRDGAADREASIKRRLMELPEEDRENPQEREKIFREIVGEDGHGHALLARVGVRPTPKRMHYSSFPSISSHDHEAEIAHLKNKLEEQGHQYQEQISHLQEQVTAYAVEVVDLRKDFLELQQQCDEKIKYLAHEIELNILLRLQNGSSFPLGFDQSSGRRQSSGNDSTTRLYGAAENNSA